jgi:hypothetical protein
MDSPSAEAWAFTHNDQYYIAITYGIIYIIEFMFNSLLARPQFLSNVGNPRAERDCLSTVLLQTEMEKRHDRVIVELGRSFSDAKVSQELYAR